MSITFAAQLNKMITAGLGGAMDAPATHVAVGYHVESETLSGNPVTFSDGDGITSLLVSFSPVQAEGTPSPDNVLPITGFDSITVTRAGTNLYDADAISENTYINVNGVLMTSSASFASNVFNVEGISELRFDYQYESLVNTDNRLIAFYNSATTNSTTFISGAVYSPGGNVRTVSVPSGAKYCRIVFDNNTDHVVITDNSDVTSITAQFGSTYYAGTIDLVSGVGTVTHQIVTLDGTESWTMLTSGKFFAPVLERYFAAEDRDYCSNLYPFAGDGDSNSSGLNSDGHFYGQRIYGRFWIYDSSLTSLDDLTTMLTATPMQIVYPLTDPISFTLDPQTLETLKGDNTLWTDGDSLTVTYRNICYTEGY